MSRPPSAARAFVAASLAAFLAAFAVAVAQDQPIQGGGNATKIQGRSVLSTAPTSGQALAWNGSAWAPATVSGGGGTATLQSAYTAGRTITVASAGTPVAITGAGSGSALTVVSGTISSPGAGSGSERFGASAAAGGARSVVLGPGASDSAFDDSVVIGGATAVAASGFSVTVGNAAATTGNGGTCLGGAAAVSGALGVAVGVSAASNAQSAIALGRASVAGHSYAMAFGDSVVTTAANQAVFGGSSSGITDFVLGNGVTDGTPTATVTIRTTGGTGAADAGTALRLRTGVSGDASTASGGILFGVAVVSSATAVTDVLKIDGTTGQLVVGGDLTASTVPGAGTVATFNGAVAMKGSILPVADNTYDLGSASYRWQLIRGVTITSGTIVEEERFAAENLAGSARVDSLRADLDAVKVGSLDGRHLPRIAMTTARHVLELEARLAALEERLAK